MGNCVQISENGGCRDMIINDPRLTLGSYVKGPNNMICRVWVWKAGPWSPDSGLIRIFMDAHTKVGLAWIAEPYIDAARRV